MSDFRSDEPHEVTIEVAATSGKRMAFVRRVEQRARYVRQAEDGTEHFADITLRIEANEQNEQLIFAHQFDADDPDIERDLLSSFVRGVERGVREWAQARASQGRAVAQTRVTLMRVAHHPLSSRESSFVVAAKTALDAACQEHGVLQTIGKSD